MQLSGIPSPNKSTAMRVSHVNALSFVAEYQLAEHAHVVGNLAAIYTISPIDLLTVEQDFDPES